MHVRPDLGATHHRHAPANHHFRTRHAGTHVRFDPRFDPDRERRSHGPSDPDTADRGRRLYLPAAGLRRVHVDRPVESRGRVRRRGRAVRCHPGRVLLPRHVPTLLHGEGGAGGECATQARDGGDDPARADLRADAPSRHPGTDTRADLHADHLLGHPGPCGERQAGPQRVPDLVLEFELSAVSRGDLDSPPDPPAGNSFPYHAVPGNSFSDHGVPYDPGKNFVLGQTLLLPFWLTSFARALSQVPTNVPTFDPTSGSTPTVSTEVTGPPTGPAREPKA